MGMMDDATLLTLSGRTVDTVFALLGTHEDDMTYSLGWTLSRSPGLLSLILARTMPAAGQPSAVRLQEASEHGGFTDVELEAEDGLVIIETKRGWTLPWDEQLERYAPRILQRDKPGVLVVLSECSREFAAVKLPKAVRGVPVTHLSWAEVAALCRQAHGDARGAGERDVLTQFRRYVEELLPMQNQESNIAMCVIIGDGKPNWSRIPWRDYVTVKRQYFHPFGRNGWPADPPNYLAFRWEGVLRSIHHVDGYEVVDPLYAKVPEIRRKAWDAHGDEDQGEYILYDLGPAIVPAKEVTNGRIYATARVTEAIDLLLTCDTIADAVRLTRERLGDE